MSLFSKKEEISLEDFCRDFYDNHILNQVVEGVDLSKVFPEYVKKTITEADNVFINIDLQKLTDEIVIIRFELFALAWLHKFGDKSAITQSIFTNHYLRDKGRVDIWDAMGQYNSAIAHATTVEKNATERGKLELAHIYKRRMDLYDEYKGDAQINEGNSDDNQFLGRCVSMAVNRLASENAWKKRLTAYFLILTLCHRFGLGYGADYLGPNEKAQLELQVFIRGLYEGAEQSWDNVKIKK